MRKTGRQVLVAAAFVPLQSAPFRPALRPKTTRQSQYSQLAQATLTQRIDDERKKREIERDRCRKQMEEEKAKDCTFAPSKGKMPPQQTQPVIVNGLSKFLEMKESAKRKADEERSAQEEAWGMKSKGM